VTLVGEHGWEERHPPQGLIQRPLPAGAEAALARAAEQAIALGLGPHLEPKRSALMFHARGMPRAEAEANERALSARWRPLAQDCGLRLLMADGGIELACTERTKGTAVHDLLAAAEPDVYPVYVGDDSTDEDAFRAIAGNGLGILVAEEPRPSLATARLPSIEAVADFLETWFHVVDIPGSTAP
jgi:trehalose-phosphatase